MAGAISRCPPYCPARHHQDMEAAVIQTVEAGHMTKDLAICIHGSKVTPDKFLCTEPL